MRAFWLTLIVVATLASACDPGRRTTADTGIGSDTSVNPDSGMTMDTSRPDTGGPVDTGTPTDTGTTTDSGMTTDTGRGDAGMTDSSMTMDTGTAVDTGTPPTDAGSGMTVDVMAGSDLTLMGDTTGGTTWNRPVRTTADPSGCPATSLSAVGLAVPYEPRLLRNTSSSAVAVTITITSTWDSYIIVYDGTMIPADPLMCLAADDDTMGTDPEVMFSLAAGQTVLVLASGFDDADLGAYTMNITAM